MYSVLAGPCGVSEARWGTAGRQLRIHPIVLFLVFRFCSKWGFRGRFCSKTCKECVRPTFQDGLTTNRACCTMTGTCSQQTQMVYCDWKATWASSWPWFEEDYKPRRPEVHHEATRTCVVFVGIFPVHEFIELNHSLGLDFRVGVGRIDMIGKWECWWNSITSYIMLYT